MCSQRQETEKAKMCPSERRSVPFRTGETAGLRQGDDALSHDQAERGGKVCWDAEQLDRYLPRSLRARIASEPLGPPEARVHTLRPGEDRASAGWRSGGWRQAHFEALMPHELDKGAPMFSAAPILPEQWCGVRAKRMQQHADLARFCRGVTIPLTLLAQWAGPTTPDAGRIPHAQAPIDFATLLLDTKLLLGWTMECPIWLDCEIAA